MLQRPDTAEKEARLASSQPIEYRQPPLDGGLRHWAIVAMLLLGCSLVLTWPWLSGRVTIPWDAKAHFHAQVAFLAQSIHSGQSPFWAPYVFGGHPQIADPQSMIFSPRESFTQASRIVHSGGTVQSSTCVPEATSVRASGTMRSMPPTGGGSRSGWWKPCRCPPSGAAVAIAARLRHGFEARLARWVRRRQGGDALPVRVHRRRLYILPTRAGAGFALLLFGMLLAGLNYANSLALFITFLQTGLVPRFPTAILATGLMILSALNGMCGLILDTVVRGRLEVRRIAYLAYPAPSRD